VPALFRKVILFYRKCSVSLKYVYPAAGRAQVLRVTTKKGSVNFF